jgi:hypothetical protein
MSYMFWIFDLLKGNSIDTLFTDVPNPNILRQALHRQTIFGR